MKRKLIQTLAVCAVVAGTGIYQARAEKVPMSQLPDRVQRAIKDYAKGETLEEVERETKNGQTVYEAEFKRDGLNRRVKFNADGTVVPETAVGARTESALHRDREPSVALTSLPAAVQKTVKEQQAGREIADIDKEVWNGKAVYEVEFKEKGPNSRVYIAADGSMVVDKDKKSAYLGTQLSEAPAPVQATVKRTVSNAEVEDVDRETKNGQVVYDVEIKQEGLNRHLTIGADGTLIDDSNNHRSVGERVREKVGLDGHAGNAVVTLEQTPAAVQKAIHEQSVAGTLKPIKREMRDGRTQYDIEFEKEGKNVRMTVNEDGTILKDNR
jgi:uncharacterized membrane protein YkoI